jgi:hypothetical protein
MDVLPLHGLITLPGNGSALGEETDYEPQNSINY